MINNHQLHLTAHPFLDVAAATPAKRLTAHSQLLVISHDIKAEGIQC